MIVFETISWKNFLSSGQHPTVVNLNSSNTTLIVGSNGSGKSTILDAICFGLFNKPFRKINRPQLVNTTNEKDCLVEINFSIGKTKWRVQRGIKPNIFKIYQNNTEINQRSSAVDQQKWLEQNVLKVDFRSFTQIVILGSSTFVPFMQLSTSHRREVIEDLLDIRIFSTMNSLIKEKIRVQKEEIRTLEFRKENLREKIKMQKSFIEQIENRENNSINFNKEKINELQKEINTYISNNESLNNKISKLNENQEKVANCSDKLTKLNNFRGKISQKVLLITKENKFFNENTSCPTCTQTIDEQFRLSKIKETRDKIDELENGYKELEDTIKKEKERELKFIALSKQISSINNEISQNNTRIFHNQKQIKELESQIQTITKQLENKNIEHEKLREFLENLEKATKELSEKKENIAYYDYVYSLLKDDGVKTKIIKKYLPFINQQVNRYLQMMDFFINFELDSEFNESIKSPIHEDFSYSSFSEGEKARIDLSLLFAWREVARVKNSANCNILLFDEVFDSSLDGFGADEFLKIIKYVVKNTNVFVISHKDGLQDKFNNVIKFEKRNGFSYKSEI